MVSVAAKNAQQVQTLFHFIETQELGMGSIYLLLCNLNDLNLSLVHSHRLYFVWLNFEQKYVTFLKEHE